MLTIMMGLNVEQFYCDSCVTESAYRHGVLQSTTIFRGAAYGCQHWLGGQFWIAFPSQMPYPVWCRPGMRSFPQAVDRSATRDLG